MKKINWNTIAREITEIEGKKTEVNIAQTKEVLKCLAIILFMEHDAIEVLEGIRRLAGGKNDKTKKK